MGQSRAAGGADGAAGATAACWPVVGAKFFGHFCCDGCVVSSCKRGPSALIFKRTLLCINAKLGGVSGY